MYNFSNSCIQKNKEVILILISLLSLLAEIKCNTNFDNVFYSTHESTIKT